MTKIPSSNKVISEIHTTTDTPTIGVTRPTDHTADDIHDQRLQSSNTLSSKTSMQGFMRKANVALDELFMLQCLLGRF